jgi:hypothetical protein
MTRPPRIVKATAGGRCRFPDCERPATVIVLDGYGFRRGRCCEHHGKLMLKAIMQLNKATGRTVTA